MTRLKQIGECEKCGQREDYKELEKHLKEEHNLKNPSYKIEIVEIDCPCCGKEEVYKYKHCPNCGIDLFDIKREYYNSLVEFVDEIIFLGWSIDSRDVEVAWSKNKYSNVSDYNVTWHRTDKESKDLNKQYELPECLAGFIEIENLKELKNKSRKENSWNLIPLRKYLEALD